MCFNRGSTPKPPKITPPAPSPPTPPPPAPPKPLPKVTPAGRLQEDESTKPKVNYGRKKSSDIRARKGTDSLKIPLNTPQTGGNTGGLNV